MVQVQTWFFIALNNISKSFCDFIDQDPDPDIINPDPHHCFLPRLVHFYVKPPFNKWTRLHIICLYVYFDILLLDVLSDESLIHSVLKEIQAGLDDIQLLFVCIYVCTRQRVIQVTMSGRSSYFSASATNVLCVQEVVAHLMYLVT